MIGFRLRFLQPVLFYRSFNDLERVWVYIIMLQ